MYLKEVEVGKLFDENNYYWSKETIRSNYELSMLEESTGLKIALAVKYIEYGDVRSISIVTTDRKHYKILYKKEKYNDKLKEYYYRRKKFI